ncbi:MAG: transposase [Planctomycetota bacterium]|nr:transposase [Planctomycetota bacterium]
MQKEHRHEHPRSAFLTFSCHERQHWMVTDPVRAVIREQLATDTRNRLIELHAWVIMANHIHLLATGHHMSVSAWMYRFKKATAFQLRSKCQLFLPPPAREGSFWMKGGGHDRTIWSWQEYWHKLEYIHFNPMRAGLCRRAEDWSWSSASDFLIRPRVGCPTLAHPPEGLVDLLWWKPSA